MSNNHAMHDAILETGLAATGMKRKTAMGLALALAGLISVNWASAQTTASATTLPTSFAVDMSENCAAGGTRAVKGSYDAASGALNTTTTLAACVARNGDKFDGTTSTNGTLVATATGFRIDIAASVNTAIVRSDLSTVSRMCTIAKNGTFTTANQTFEGTTSQTNCAVTGKVLEHEGLVEHLLRAAHGLEDGGGMYAGTRMMPPRRGEDSIHFQFDVAPMGGIGGSGGMFGTGGIGGMGGTGGTGGIGGIGGIGGMGGTGGIGGMGGMGGRR